MSLSAWFRSLPAFANFAQVAEAEHYTPARDDQAIGLTDVVNSTAAIAAGRYKSVNMVGAAGICAVMNALSERDLPFVFGGDGASFLFDLARQAEVERALAMTAAWAMSELGLELRTAVIPVEAIRKAGHDVLVARFTPSAFVSYAMFMGGGLNWAEQQMKAGLFTVPPATVPEPPDLSGLSCRWQPMPNQRGTILSLIVRPTLGARPGTFADIVGTILVKASADGTGAYGPQARLRYKWPPDGLDLEARATRGQRSRWSRKLVLWGETLVALVLFRTGWTMNGFNPGHYSETSRLNTDFRKVDDGLRMTIDCSLAAAENIEAHLDLMAGQGLIVYGTHRQQDALMTCIVPSIHSDDHLHFLDGAAGGYAAAAKQMKLRFAT